MHIQVLIACNGRKGVAKRVPIATQVSSGNRASLGDACPGQEESENRDWRAYHKPTTRILGLSLPGTCRFVFLYSYEYFLFPKEEKDSSWEHRVQPPHNLYSSTPVYRTGTVECERQLQGLNKADRQPLSTEKHIMPERLVFYPHRLGVRPSIGGSVFQNVL